MNIMPAFVTKDKIIKYDIEIIDFDIEDELKVRNISFASWGRLSIANDVGQCTYKFSDDIMASEILKNMLKNGKIEDSRVIIVWSNAIKTVLSSKIELIKNHPLEVITEDWDFWIFGGDWIIEKYHEGELVLIYCDAAVKDFH